MTDPGPERGGAALISLSAALGTRDRARIAAALRHAARAADPAATEEVLLQAHLFVGFPDALEAMIAWRELVPAAAPPAEEDGDPAARGAATCARVYGGSYRKLRRNVVALHPELDRWMVEHGYGRVLGRPRLPLATRELCIAALLATWDAPRQLHSHLRGALNAGAPEPEVDAAVEIACGYLEEPAAGRVRDLWARVRSSARVGR
jgi:4-carboxymuconolactone decarboxylase